MIILKYNLQWIVKHRGKFDFEEGLTFPSELFDQYAQINDLKDIIVSGTGDLDLKDKRLYVDLNIKGTMILPCAKKLGYRFKMIAQAKEVNNGIGIDVAATLVSKKELVANVMDAYNVVEIDNDYVENVIYYGKGAGRYVTASAVVSDIIKTTQVERWDHDYEDCSNIYPITKSKYYLRTNKPLDVDYEMYFTEKHDHIYITHEIELADLTTDLGDTEYTIFKVRG